jgi:hypothetical protein
MNAQELRINNWIAYDTGERCQVVAINEGEIAVDLDREFLPESEYSPIPLTPEILEMAGFDGDRLIIAYNDTDSPTSLWYLDTGHIEIGRSGIGAITITCTHLHQLQNLIFALTGTELNIQL